MRGRGSCIKGHPTSYVVYGHRGGEELCLTAMKHYVYQKTFIIDIIHFLFTYKSLLMKYIFIYILF